MAQSSTTVHHEDIAAELAARHEALLTAIRDGVSFAQTRDRLTGFLRQEVLTHMWSEETFLYASARDNDLAELADAMEFDHDAQVALVEKIETTQTPLDAARMAQAFETLLLLRIEKEEKILLPALENAGVDLDELLHGKPKITGD